MSLQKIIKKFFFIELLVFLLINSSSIGFYKVNFQDSTDQEDPIPYVFGQFGENQWYISAVIVGFYYDSERVKEINYKLEDIWYTTMLHLQ